MMKFYETGVAFTNEQKEQIVNTINGFRGFSPAVKPCKREFIVGKVKVRIILSHTNSCSDYDAHINIECGVGDNYGRYGNSYMVCYSHTIIPKGQLRRLDWKMETIKAFIKDIFGDVEEANENQNQVENNTTISNTPETFDTPEAFVMGVAYENDGCMQSCVEMYGDRFIKAVSTLWNNHLQNMTENYNILYNDDIMFGMYLSYNYYINEKSAIQFWNEVAKDSELFMKISNYFEWYNVGDIWYFKPCIIEDWEEYVEYWATGMVDDRAIGIFGSLEEVFDETDIYPMFEEFIKNSYNYTDESNIEFIYDDDMSEELVNPIEVFNKLVEEAEKESNEMSVVDVVDKVKDILNEAELDVCCGNLTYREVDDESFIVILNNGNSAGAVWVKIPNEITDELLYSLAKYYTIIDDLNSYNVRYDCEQFNFEIFSSKTKVNKKLEFTEGKDWYEGLMKDTIDEHINTLKTFLLGDK